MFGIFKKTKRYQVEDLYVGVIGEVKRSESKYSYYCTSENLTNPIIIIIKEDKDKFAQEQYRIQITCNVKYDYFHSEVYLSKFLGKCMIYKELPLVSLFPELKGKSSISFEEIKNYEEELNSALHIKEEPEEPTDKVMLEINKLIKKAKNILNQDIKTKILEDIKALATYYVESKITIQMGSTGSNLSESDPESQLVRECLRKLCEIELEINQSLEGNDLLKDMQILSRNIGSVEVK